MIEDDFMRLVAPNCFIYNCKDNFNKKTRFHNCPQIVFSDESLNLPFTKKWDFYHQPPILSPK